VLFYSLWEHWKSVFIDALFLCLCRLWSRQNISNGHTWIKNGCRHQVFVAWLDMGIDMVIESISNCWWMPYFRNVTFTGSIGWRLTWMALIWFLLTYILLLDYLLTPVSMGLGGKLWIMCRWNSSSTGHRRRRRALRTNLRSMWQCIHLLRLICSGVEKSMYISTSWPAFLYQ